MYLASLSRRPARWDDTPPRWPAARDGVKVRRVRFLSSFMSLRRMSPRVRSALSSDGPWQDHRRPDRPTPCACGAVLMSLNTLVDARRGAPARRMWRSTLTALVLATVSCTSFATVRSAEVQPGPSLALQASVTTLPGDDAGWFWSYDCEAECNDPIVGGDAGFTYGWAGAKSFALSAGASGSHPPHDPCGRAQGSTCHHAR